VLGTELIYKDFGKIGSVEKVGQRLEGYNEGALQ